MISIAHIELMFILPRVVKGKNKKENFPNLLQEIMISEYEFCFLEMARMHDFAAPFTPEFLEHLCLLAQACFYF